LLHAGRVSLAVGLAAMAVTVLIGAVVGAVAGYRGGLVDTLLLRLTDAMLSFPPIFILLALAAFVRPSLASMTVIIGVTSWMDVTRMVRSQILTLREREFVLGARALGAPASRILARHLFPNNGASIAWALASRGVGRVVLCEKGALASGASGRSSALVRMHYTNETDARLAFASFPIFRHWTELMGGGPPVFTHTGFVNVVAPPYAEHLRKNVEVLRRIGINTVALSPGELRGLEPHANVDDIGAAAYEPESGYANPADTGGA